jgi:hypothetical protein
MRPKPEYTHESRAATEPGTGMRTMKPQPDLSTKEVLAGLVERVTYHNAETE